MSRTVSWRPHPHRWLPKNIGRRSSSGDERKRRSAKLAQLTRSCNFIKRTRGCTTSTELMQIRERRIDSKSISRGRGNGISKALSRQDVLPRSVPTLRVRITTSQLTLTRLIKLVDPWDNQHINFERLYASLYDE